MNFVCIHEGERDKYGEPMCRVTGLFFSRRDAETYARHFNARGYSFEVLSESEARSRVPNV